MKIIRNCIAGIILLLLLSAGSSVLANTRTNGIVKLYGKDFRVDLDTTTGRINYYFNNSIRLVNTVAYVQELNYGMINSAEFARHSYQKISLGYSPKNGYRIDFIHSDDQHPFKLIQHLAFNDSTSALLISVELVANNPYLILETRNISPLALLPSQQGSYIMPGSTPRILDVPFDNDNWVDVLPRSFNSNNNQQVSGIGYEFASLYDYKQMLGMVVGSITHEFWKTGISYGISSTSNLLDSLVVYGGAAVPDQPSLPQAYGGRDGTHDYTLHGTMKGSKLQSPTIFLCGMTDVRKAFVQYGNANVAVTGRLQWNKKPPFYWNSFAVEGVLGYGKKMMPDDVLKISDFIYSLPNFSKNGTPVISIDSYDQELYSTDVLKSIAKHAAKNNQELGFYFSPFSVWNWKNNLEKAKINGTKYYLRDVILRDEKNNPIPYKDGDWGCFPIDPTHPATREYIIGQLQKAKAIGTKFLKADFMTAGALESTVRYDSSIRTGMQAYTYGMKMMKQLIDSIMGPDIFIWQAISPMFPSQYSHCRFISTDVYSHLRNDQAGFPYWGSTESSVVNGSHLWWMQGTLWPFTNADVAIMKNFQTNPDISEQEVKVRLYGMMVMGSILGDGSDYRHPIAAMRAKKYLDNPALCNFFSRPQAFTPLKFSDGVSLDQQLSFYLPGHSTLVALFNFHKTENFKETIKLDQFGLKKVEYEVRDFLTNDLIGIISEKQTTLDLTIPVLDAIMIKLIPVKERKQIQKEKN